MNFALKNFSDSKDTSRISTLSNELMEAINRNSFDYRTRYKTIQYNDGRTYNIQYREESNLMMIERV